MYEDVSEYFMDNKCIKCIFATTKYQIMNAIHIQMTQGGPADLYIIDDGYYADCNEIINRIRMTKIFDNTIRIDVKKILSFSKSHYINGLIAYLNFREIVCSYLLQRNYGLMLFCTNSLIERLTKIYFIQLNFHIRILLYDEGVGSYVGEYERKKINADKIVRKIFLKKETGRVYYDKLLYAPQLYYLYGEPGYGVIYKIPPIRVNSPEIGVYNRIFGMEEKMVISQRVILLDINRERIFNRQGEECYNDLLQKISTMCKDKIVFKSHPSNPVKDSEKSSYYEYSELPFELIIANSSVKDKILISINSTSLITPKILFDQEPVIILLYEIMKENLIRKDEGFFLFWERVSRIYDPNRFYIPKTEEELWSILERLLYGTEN